MCGTWFEKIVSDNDIQRFKNVFFIVAPGSEGMATLNYATVLMLSGPGKPELIQCYYPAAMLPDEVDRVFKSADQESVL